MDTIARNLAKYPLLVLDGAFGTELARRGFDTNDELWSAKALFEKPELVEAVHRDYYEAGADISTSASYQATVEGFEKKGFTREQAKELIVRSVRLVQRARDAFWQQKEKRIGRPSRSRPHQSDRTAPIWPTARSTAATTEQAARSSPTSMRSASPSSSQPGRTSWPARRCRCSMKRGPSSMTCAAIPTRAPGSRSRARMPSTPVAAMPSPTARACSTRRARSRPSASTARRHSTWRTSSATSVPIRQSPSSSTRTRARRTMP